VELKDYLESRNFDKKEFAELIDVSQSALSNYLYKRREPRPEIRARILAACKGKVTVEDLLKK